MSVSNDVHSDIKQKNLYLHVRGRVNQDVIVDDDKVSFLQKYFSFTDNQIVFDGCILNLENTFEQCKIRNNATVFIIKKQTNPIAPNQHCGSTSNNGDLTEFLKVHFQKAKFNYHKDDLNDFKHYNSEEDNVRKIDIIRDERNIYKFARFQEKITGKAQYESCNINKKKLISHNKTGYNNDTHKFLN